jgi:hypothetical protein
MQDNSGNRMKRSFGIQFCDIDNNPGANNEINVSFRGLVVFTCEASESFPDSFTEQIKLIVEKRELPFILCFKHARGKCAEKNILLKKAMITLQDNLKTTHLIIRTGKFSYPSHF